MKFLILAIVLSTANMIVADWEAYKQAIIRFDALGIKNDPEYERQMREAPKQEKVITFPCSAIPPSPTVPTSVHKLRPSDIKVVGAIGDSLTAANGAKATTLFGLLTEYRGVSWSIGGDKDYKSQTTLPNLLRVYNPTLKGFSLNTGSYTSSGSGFNIAQPGHTSHEMLAQAQELVKRIKADKNIDFNNDWKLITFFVGGNDLCKHCNDKAKYEIVNYEANLRNTLDYLQANLPRALINLVLTLDVRGTEILAQGFVCSTMVNYLCDCIKPANYADLNRLVDGYQLVTKNLIKSGRYDTKTDFTVVLQPFMEEMRPPTKPNSDQPDLTYFAPDCFHFSVKGHETAALELWNNMFQPVGQKSNVWTQDVGKINCPSLSTPFIYTNLNS